MARGPQSNSQYPSSYFKMSVTAVPGDPVCSSDSLRARNARSTQTHMQTKHSSNKTICASITFSFLMLGIKLRVLHIYRCALPPSSSPSSAPQTQH